jgi:hypothetical protein
MTWNSLGHIENGIIILFFTVTQQSAFSKAQHGFNTPPLTGSCRPGRRSGIQSNMFLDFGSARHALQVSFLTGVGVVYEAWIDRYFKTGH